MNDFIYIGSGEFGRERLEQLIQEAEDARLARIATQGRQSNGRIRQIRSFLVKAKSTILR